MSVNVAESANGDHHDSTISSTSILDAVSSSRVVTDNIAGRNMEEAMVFKAVDIVYTWVNGSDPRHAKGSFLELSPLFPNFKNLPLRPPTRF